MSLLKQLVLSFCIFALLPLIIFGAVDYSHSVRYLKSSALNELHAISAIQVERLHGQLNQHRDRVQLIASNPDLKSYLYDYANEGQIDTGRVAVSLENAIMAISSVKAVSIYDLDNRLITSVVAPGRTISNDEAHIEANASKPPVELDFDAERSEIHLTQDVMHFGDKVGSLSVTTDARYFTRIFTTYNGFGESGESILFQLDNAGQVTPLHPLRFATGNSLRAAPLNQPVSAQRMEYSDAFDYRGEAVMASGRVLPELGWGIMVKKDVAEILHPANAILARLNAAILIIAALAVFFAYKVASYIYAPIRALATLARSVQSGDLSQRANFRDLGEIGILARAMDGMIDRLTQDNAELEKIVEQRTSEAHAARLRAEEKTRMQSEFLANMSHEIRTPMNGIIGVANLLKTTPLSKEQLEYIDILEHSGSSLLVIINDILDLSKLRSGKLELSQSDFDLHQELQLLIREFRDTAARKQLSLELQIEPSAPRWVHGDPVRLKQILVNLIGNGLKFTQRGGVSLSLRQEGEQLEFTVRDTGIGIEQQDLDKIFDAFTQIDGSLTRRAGGTGLGLSIVHQLVLQMQGQILCDSAVNKGSTFILRLPLNAAQSTPSPPPHLTLLPGKKPAPARKSLSLLIAEDNTVNQRIISDLLASRGHKLTIVSNGAEAVREFQSQPFDKILMDVQMPVMDGLAASRKIRELEPQNGHHIPIIALTAHAMADDKERCITAGMSQYLSKPIDPEQLIHQVEGLPYPTDEMPLTPANCEGLVPKDMLQMILDEARVRDITHNKPALIATIAQLFLSELPEMTDEIDRVLAQGDRKQLSSSVHRIKSALGNFSSKAFYDEVAELETNAQCQDLSEWTTQWQAAKDKLGQMSDELKVLAGI
ncbi:response regulator [Spongiibacter sp. KMU-166]|uniref:histidine kinase n=1 Tax=Spongiibacter thalassae TaxID=2721624 RepID=A0ABX1GCI6_9GAMM|nr:ATP-binding protein [Spongiibacter thalassae]NKI16203.1 response regulator [Spongiibacter thalassae]